MTGQIVERENKSLEVLDRLEGIRKTMEAGTPENTKRMKEHALKEYGVYCQGHGLDESEEASLYFWADSMKETHKAATIKSYGYMILKAKRFDSVNFGRYLRALEREKAETAEKKKVFTLTDIMKALSAMGDTPKDKRDRAMILLSFFTGRRSAETVKIKRQNIERTEDGYKVLIPGFDTKTGNDIAFTIGKGSGDLDPVEALDNWIALSEGDYLFSSVTKCGQVTGRQLDTAEIRRLAKRTASLSGHDPDQYSSHSFRSSFITLCQRKGVEMPLIMKYTGHRTAQMITEYYQANDRDQADLTGRILG